MDLGPVSQGPAGRPSACPQLAMPSSSHCVSGAQDGAELSRPSAKALGWGDSGDSGGKSSMAMGAPGTRGPRWHLSLSAARPDPQLKHRGEAWGCPASSRILSTCYCPHQRVPAAAAPATLGVPALSSRLHGCPPPSCTGHPSCPVTWRLAGAVLDVTGPGADGLLSHLFPPPGSKSSGSTRSSRRAPGREKERRAAGAGGSGSESDHTAPSGVGSSWRERPAGQLSRGSSPRSQASATAPGLPPPHPMTKAYTVVGGPPGGPPVRELAAVPPELTGSRQSFQKAMGNPCEFFVDIM